MKENTTIYNHNGNASEIYKDFFMAYTVYPRGAFATQSMLDHRSQAYPRVVTQIPLGDMGSESSMNVLVRLSGGHDGRAIHFPSGA
jgi:hypothetical protein